MSTTPYRTTVHRPHFTCSCLSAEMLLYVPGTLFLGMRYGHTMLVFVIGDRSWGRLSEEIAINGLLEVTWSQARASAPGKSAQMRCTNCARVRKRRVEVVRGTTP